MRYADIIKKRAIDSRSSFVADLGSDRQVKRESGGVVNKERHGRTRPSYSRSRSGLYKGTAALKSRDIEYRHTR